MGPKIAHLLQQQLSMLYQNLLYVFPLKVNFLTRGGRCCGAYFIHPSFFILQVTQFSLAGSGISMCSPNYDLIQQEFKRLPRVSYSHMRELHTCLQSVLYLEYAVAYVTPYFFLLVQLMTFMSRYFSKDLVKLLGPSVCVKP